MKRWERRVFALIRKGIEVVVWGWVVSTGPCLICTKTKRQTRRRVYVNIRWGESLLYKLSARSIRRALALFGGGSSCGL